MSLASGRRLSIAFRTVNAPGKPGYAAGLQRHHLLPLQLLRQRGLARLLAELGPARVGYYDFRRNGLLLPATEEGALRLGLPLHRGPHRRYNAMVAERVGQIEAQWCRSARGRPESATIEALMRLDLLQRALRRRLLDRRGPSAPSLNMRDPALDFSHLDRMVDLLWSASEATA